VRRLSKLISKVRPLMLFLGLWGGVTLLASGSHVRVSLLAEVSAVSAGEPFWVAVRLDHDPGWHTYYKEPGDSGLPTKIVWDLPEGFTAGPIQWPVPQRIELPPLVNFGYEGEATLLVLISPPTRISGDLVTLGAQVTWLECQEACVPGQADVSMTLPVSSSPVPPAVDKSLFFDHARGLLENFGPPRFSDTAKRGNGINVWFAILLAFIGGMILNLMPCVLPVLSIKVFGFIETPRETLRRDGLLYGAGVVISFLILAGLLIFLRAGGEKLGWGFQLQSPLFVGFMATLFLLLGLNMWGVFELGTSFTRPGTVVWGKILRERIFQWHVGRIGRHPLHSPFYGIGLGICADSTLGSLVGHIWVHGPWDGFSLRSFVLFPRTHGMDSETRPLDDHPEKRVIDPPFWNVRMAFVGLGHSTAGINRKHVFTSES
jgi:cytochrome c biogenesis protein CcdA